MPPETYAASTKRDNTTPSCAVCNRRKVKCDRVYPCLPCRKTGLECTFPPESARKRARRKPPTPPPDHGAEPGTGQPNGDKGFRGRATTDSTEEGSAHGGRVAGGITHEFVGNEKGTTSDEDMQATHYPHVNLIFGPEPSPAHKPLSVTLAQAVTIGNAYMVHVDPVVKVFHSESAWIEVMDFTQSLDHCLFRALYFVTAVATDGTGFDGPLGWHGQGLIQRCRADAERALYGADFMRTREFRVLQGLVLYLVALQSLGEDETVWSMLGMAIRIASTLGLPQDIGEDALRSSTQPPYRLEMRRRLWWAIIALDARVTRILGRTGYLSHNFSQVPLPANVNNSLLFPSMSEITEDTVGPTDTIYVRYRATLSDILPFIYASGNAKDKCTDLMQMIDGAEREIEEKFIQYCDQTVPIQLLTFVAGRGYIKRVKLAMYSIYPDTDDAATQAPYASEAFRLAKDSMELFILSWTDPSIKQWQWHWKDFFGWHTLRMLVKEISKRSSCSNVIEAWKLVKRAASLVVSALKLSEKKARLVGDLRMLIEAGDVQPAAPPEGYSYAQGSTVRSVRPGMGTNPHNALLPGMSSSLNHWYDADEDRGGAIDRQGSGFDLKKVNWTEIDRVLVQLGAYHGG